MVTLDRAQDRADLYRVDRTGAARHVLTQTDPAWVNQIDFHFLADGNGVVATSQDAGHTHLYRYGPDGERLQPLTEGEWSVRGLAAWQASTIATTIDEAHGYAYFTARRPDLTQIQLYRVGLDGSGLARVSSEGGVHQVRWSDDRRFYLDWQLEPRPPAVAVAPRRVGDRAGGALRGPPGRARGPPPADPRAAHRPGRRRPPAAGAAVQARRLRSRPPIPAHRLRVRRAQRPRGHGRLDAPGPRPGARSTSRSCCARGTWWRRSTPASPPPRPRRWRT